MLRHFSRCLNYRLLICTYGNGNTRLYSLTSNFGKVKSNQRFLLMPSCTPTNTFANMSTNIKAVTYQDILKMKDDTAILLIDVREPSELQETGVLPGSINIPLGQLENVLRNKSSSEFLKEYGRPKPNVDFSLAFSCKSGRRSENAALIALKLGYKNVQNYSGGWLDYEQNQNNK